MRKLRRITCILCLCAVISGCGGGETPPVLSGTVEADEFDLFALTSGVIAEVIKDEGDSVSAGETVALIDDADARAELKSARAKLEQACAARDEAEAGTRPEQIEQAQAALEQAQAQLDGLKAGKRPEEIAQAEALAREAKARLDDLRSGSREQQLEQARAQLSQTESAVENARRGYVFYSSRFENEQAMESAGSISRSELDEARVKADDALYQLKAAEEQYEIARSQLSLLESGATPKAIEAAQAQYEQAAANAALAHSGATAEAIAAAQALVDQNRAALELLLNGRTPEQLRQATAGVDAAEAAVELAENQLSKCNIVSPAGGILLYKTTETGSVVNPGALVATVQSQDSFWVKVYVPQTYNGKVTLGDKASITAPNLPGVDISGTVVFISPKAEFTPKNIETTQAKQENTVFCVKVRVDDHLDAIKPGMNAYVSLGGLN